MGKKVFIVSSSPRKNGNSDILAQEFARGAEAAGHTVQKVDIRSMSLKFCIGCMSCHKTGKCALNDGINELLPSVGESDVIVFATPVYYYSVSGQLKTFFDRMNPLYGLNNKFTDVYLLATAAEDEDSAMDGSVTAVQGWIDCFSGVKLVGELRATGVDSVGEIAKTAYPARAYEMGKNI